MAFVKTICLDFDGVCNTYTGWKGEDFLFEPREGLGDFLYQLRDLGFGKIVIHSTRPASKIKEWLVQYNLSQFVDDVVDKKPAAFVYLDDRAVQFTGSFSDAIKSLRDFRVFWETPKLVGV